MKIGLINPPYTYKADPSNLDFVHLGGISQIHSSLKKAGHTVAKCDFQYDQKASLEQVADCEVVGLSAFINCYNFFRQVLPELKKQNSRRPIIVGGPFISSYGLINNLLMKVFPEIDYAVIGEGERTAVSLVGSLEKQTDLPRGVIFRSKKELENTGLAPQLEKLDDSPQVDYEDWPDFSKAAEGHFFNIQFSRGCNKPIPCTFCFRQFPNVRSYSLGRIEQEIIALKALSPKAVTVGDDTFTYDRERATAVGKLLKKHLIPYRIEARVDAIDSELVKMLAETGCDQIKFGVETFDQRLLGKANKGIKVESIYHAAKICRDYGITPSAFILLGLPGENKKSIERTLQGLKETGMIPRARLLIPLPGTQIYREALRRGLINETELLKQLSDPAHFDTAEGNWVPINMSDGLNDRELIDARNNINSLRKD